jgi:hypothetical protein
MSFQKPQDMQFFETIRNDSRIPKLKRIGHRDSLEQRVCTITLTGALPKQASMGVFGFYKTAHPESTIRRFSCLQISRPHGRHLLSQRLEEISCPSVSWQVTNHVCGC